MSFMDVRKSCGCPQNVHCIHGGPDMDTALGYKASEMDREDFLEAEVNALDAEVKALKIWKQSAQMAMRDALRTLTEASEINSDRRASVHMLCGMLDMSEEETLKAIDKARR